MKISVIIPVYNVEKHLEICLDSIINQTFSDFEIIVVDDASTDSSLNILQKYSNNDKQIIIVRHEDNQGTMVARESGYRNASGDYLVFVDSDDSLPKNALHDLYEKAVLSDADLIIGNYTYIDKYGKSHPCLQPLRYGLDTDSIFKSLLLREIKHTLWGKMYKTHFLTKNKFDIFKKQYKSNDSIMFYQLVSLNPKVVKVESNTYIYRYRENSVDNIDCSELLMDNLVFSYQYRLNLLKKRPNLKKLSQKYFLHSFLELKRRGYKKGFIASLFGKYEIKHLISWYMISQTYVFPLSFAVWVFVQYINNTYLLRHFITFLKRTEQCV